MQTAKAQISLRIRAVWSGPSLSAYRIIGYRMYEWRALSQMILCTCAGCIESAQSAHAQMHFFASLAICVCIYTIFLREIRRSMIPKGRGRLRKAFSVARSLYSVTNALHYLSHQDLHCLIKHFLLVRTKGFKWVQQRSCVKYNVYC